MSGARGPAAVDACPVCGSPMARGERYRVQVLREAPVTYRSRTSWTWQMVGSTLACPGCAGAVEELLEALHELAWAECDRALYGEEVDECPGR